MRGAIVAAAIGMTTTAALAVTVWVAGVATTSASTGIAADQRPWVVILLTLGEFGLGCLFLLLVDVWLFGTARIPRWARDAFWARNEVPAAIDLARSGGWSVLRVASAVLVYGAILAALGAPVLGIMIGWVLNPNDVLTTVERWGVIAALVGQVVWGAYLLQRLRHPEDGRGGGK